MTNQINGATVKSIVQKRGNFKKFITSETASFGAGEIFIDFKGSKVDLLVSCGNNLLGRIPLERFTIDEYINFRYPEGEDSGEAK